MPKVLVVDDAPMVEGFMQQAMKTAGHEVAGVARNGRQAVELYGKLRPDLVTMDLNMPELNGLEALKEIVTLDPKAKVIIITAMDQPLIREDLLQAGAKAVLGKPIRLERLMQTVGAVLSGR
jgi:two-component system chemotaxis response regulator CheY